MIDFLDWCFIGFLVIFFVSWVSGYALRRSNNTWYRRICTERYLKTVSDSAIKEVLDDLYKKKEGEK